VFAVLGGLTVFAAPVAAQSIRLDIAAALVTDRNVGVRAELPPARGPGLAGTATARIARFEGELTGLAAWLQLPSSAPAAEASRTFAQMELRIRYWLAGPFAVEGGIVGRVLDPDPDGEAVGFITTGAFVRWPVARSAWIWGRLGFVPWATFEGGGSSGFAAETSVGVELQLSRRLRAAATYGFQRIDRNLTEPDGMSFRAPVEFDVLRIGIQWSPGQSQGDTP
jgi:hypothetical protein